MILQFRKIDDVGLPHVLEIADLQEQ